MLKKGTSEILKIEDPVQRLAAAVIFQAFLDYDYSDEYGADAEEFLSSGGGEWSDIVDYKVSDVFDLYKKKKEELKNELRDNM